jgi:hypothetical protein
MARVSAGKNDVGNEVVAVLLLRRILLRAAVARLVLTCTNSCWLHLLAGHLAATLF